MMLGGGAKAYVCAEPVDMRKSIDGLAQLVAPLLRGDAFSGSVFVFLSRRPSLPIYVRHLPSLKLE